MRNFKVTVNGNTYDVTVEDITADSPSDFSSASNSFSKERRHNVSNIPSAPVSSAPMPAQNGSDGNIKVDSPMPGTIVDIKVSVGDKVEAGAVVVILEAMKMENEIVAPSAGTVASIKVNKGASVSTGDVLVTIAE